MTTLVQPFGQLAKEQAPLAGGKGGTLARLYQAGYPVPDGFVILPQAFEGDNLREAAWTEVQAQLAAMRHGAPEELSFAVRSSALSEDSAHASFAGEFETVLDVRSDELIRAAIHTVHRSKGSDRVRAYSQAHGLDTAHQMAVVVQRLVRADVSGVLFTADPVSGSRLRMTGNFVFGFGEELVSGEAEPYTFTLERTKGRYRGPQQLKPFARTLFKLGQRLEQYLGSPQDIEWAIAGGTLYLLQSRPITTLAGGDSTTGAANASLTGDYLWTNVLMAELFPRVATPSSQSLWQIILDQMSGSDDLLTFGWIAGRPYLNYSLMYAFLSKVYRREERIREMLKATIALPPGGMEIPPAPLSMKTVILGVLPREIRKELTKQRLMKNREAFLSEAANRCRALRRRMTTTEDKKLLAELWRNEIKPLLLDLHTLQDAYNERYAQHIQKLRKDLLRVAGQGDVDSFLAAVGSGPEELASAGPLLGLLRLQAGQLTRAEYLDRYGHRGPYENYLAVPRPSEDPGWIDSQLANLSDIPASVRERLVQGETAYDTEWAKLKAGLEPKVAGRIEDRVQQARQICQAREATRSELTRMLGSVRDLFLRAGDLTGHGENAFFLTIEELLQLLAGDDSATASIPARRETYRKLQALPQTPAWIRGRFDPFQWAADPERRIDIFDAYAPVSSLASSQVIQGNPGSAGRVEGIVRRIDNPEDGSQLVTGEVLVTNTTNVGWTPLFPRASAIVTDIGGALSHAAIVAREIGIPAVVGCGDATMRLRTGDRIRVDGGRGTVEILSPA